MAELANCSSCGNVFVKQLKDICKECYKKEEAAFQIVYDFLRQQRNREATLTEVVEATGVEETLITKFIKENRLRTSMFPKLGYPCEKCGTMITTGKLCGSCSTELQNELSKLEAIDKVAERNKETEKETRIYYTLDKNRR
ncbi:TIGR03826 family flagellar region protein [Ornithinibacillus scapharcae]|uniref:TIGR03826 family flagellar region protein n=1 Tax=Ornithinibacillus scapharcae TaxID=1147159 RepID=UPI000225B3DB|nr:TIGR03826 family flagellar region protein [Ornithinibacillus scapharcae]